MDAYVLEVCVLSCFAAYPPKEENSSLVSCKMANQQVLFLSSKQQPFFVPIKAREP